MAHKIVCIDCRMVFYRDLPEDEERIHECPGCGRNMVNLSDRFLAPPRKNFNRWETVQYLVSNGFRYQLVVADDVEIPYPENLNDARAFVETYKDQALKI
jgi:hypothetical protein